MFFSTPTGSKLGLVVQSIVSLTMSLRCHLVKYMPTTLSNTLLFLLKKCEKCEKSPFFSLIFHLLSHYYKTIRTAFSTLKNCQKTHLEAAYHSSKSGKQKKIKHFLLLLKSMQNGVIDFLRQGGDMCFKISSVSFNLPN